MTAPYHMIEYIHEIPQVLAKTLEENEAGVQAVVKAAKKKQIRKIVVIGLGSSYYASLIAAPLFLNFSSIPTYIFPATELGPYMATLIDSKSLVIAVSRSGERGWVVDALKEAIQLGALGLAITGTPNGLLAQNAQFVLVTAEGPEITFAKTKSVATCAGLLMRLALAFARPDNDAHNRLQKLNSTPLLLEETIRVTEPEIISLMPQIQVHKMVMAGGTVSNHGAALEFAIKLQEAANVPVIGNDTGNVLHGPWGPVNPGWLMLLLVTRYDHDLSKKTLSLAGKLRCHRLVICEPGLKLDGQSEFTITLPKPVDIYSSGLNYLMPLQLLTYYWSFANGLNPDAPAGMRDMLDAMLPPGREEPEMLSGTSDRK